MLNEILNSKMEYFLKCAEEQSLVHAAFKIGITQPALSSAIKKLEDELGEVLFLRSKKGIKLTDAGLRLYQEMSGVQSELRTRISRSLKQDKSAVLRIGCVGHLASRYFLDVLDADKKNLPIVHLYTSTSLDCYERVIEGSLEFAFVAWSSVPKRLNSIKIAKEPVAFIGLREKFPDLEKIKTLKEMKKYPWVDLPKPQRDWTRLLEADKPGYIARDVRILRDIVLRGLAVGYLQLNFFTAAERKRLAIAPLPPFYPNSAIYVVYKKEISEVSLGHMNRLVRSFQTMVRTKQD